MLIWDIGIKHLIMSKEMHRNCSQTKMIFNIVALVKVNTTSLIGRE